MLFLIQGSIESQEQQQVRDLIEHEFVTGQNLYVTEFWRFVETLFVLWGETGRRESLVEVGNQLDSGGADLSHRRRWAALLSEL